MVLEHKEVYELNDSSLILNNKVKFDYLSDIHINYYFQYPEKNENIKNFFTRIFMSGLHEKSDILIIAGDLGEDNYLTNQMLNILLEHYKYVFFVLGNHDLYIKTLIEIDDYEDNSFNKIAELKNMVRDNDRLFFLDGGIINVNGIKVGGTMSWYDGSYMYKYKNQHYTLNDSKIQKDWRTFIDSKYIKVAKKFNTLFHIEEEKIIYLMNEANIIITHMLPSNNRKHINKLYLKEPLDTMTTYFCFDGLDKYEKEINEDLQYWVYGHSHLGLEFTYKGIEVLNNCLGGIQESNYGGNTKMQSFEYEIKGI